MKTKTIISTILGLSLLYGLLPAQENDVHKDWLMPLPMLNATVQNQVRQYPPIPGMADTQYWNYIPYDNQVNLEVNVNLVFIQKDNGSGNFQENDPEHKRIWDDITAGINNIYAAFKDSEKDSCFAWRDRFISDSKIRFKFNRYYWTESYFWDWTIHGKTAFQISNKLDTMNIRSIENMSSMPSGISVFFTENGNLFDEYMDIILAGGTSPDKAANFAYTSTPKNIVIPLIYMPDTYCKFLWVKHILPKNYAAEGQTMTWDYLSQGWKAATAILLAHELGHALDLNHGNNHYGQDYCRDALMSPSGHAGYTHSYMPPTEIGRMYKALSTLPVRQVVPDDIPVIGTMKVTQKLHWDGPYRCYTDVSIAESGGIGMRKEIWMPKDSKIEVAGQLYLKNADIRCITENGHWSGIRVKKGGLLWVENTTASNYDIIMEPGSTLVLRGEVGFTNGHKLILDEGVYVCVSENFALSGTEESPFCVNGAADKSVLGGIAPGIRPWYAVACSDKGWTSFKEATTGIPEVLYVQNRTLTQDEKFVARKIFVGNAVDPDPKKRQGNVTISTPARATFIGKDKVVFDKGFRCQPGGSYKVMRFSE